MFFSISFSGFGFDLGLYSSLDSSCRLIILRCFLVVVIFVRVFFLKLKEPESEESEESESEDESDNCYTLK
jgi:hypothetical protein